jgi:transposase
VPRRDRGLPTRSNVCSRRATTGSGCSAVLAQAGIACRVMDPANLMVDRRGRRVKTDRVDAECLLRALQAWRRGDRHACSFVLVPSVEEEDARRPHRELARLTKERVAHVNRIKGLLALHGVRPIGRCAVTDTKRWPRYGPTAARLCRPTAALKSSGGTDGMDAPPTASCQSGGVRTT